jgi:hypothetical protein
MNISNLSTFSPIRNGWKLREQSATLFPLLPRQSLGVRTGKTRVISTLFSPVPLFSSKKYVASWRDGPRREGSPELMGSVE